MANETMLKFGYPDSLICDYEHWVVLLRPAQVTRGSLVLAAKSDATAFGQLDPEKRRLIQLGYNQPLEGSAPIAAYGFFYYNRPGFINTNLTLRTALAPIYMDSELGISGQQRAIAMIDLQTAQLHAAFGYLLVLGLLAESAIGAGS